MKTKLKINEHCSIRTDGDLYCLTDLYHFMDMRNARSAPQHWAVDRMGLPLIKKGFFRKTYWARESILLKYAESLTPGIFKEVKVALGIVELPEHPADKLSMMAQEKLRTISRAPAEHFRRSEPQYEKMIQRAERRAPARRTQSAPTRGLSHGSRGSSSHRSQEDGMLTQMLIMDSVLNEPSRSHRSVDTGSCEAPRHSSYSDDSSRHSSYSSHSSHHSSHDSYSSSSYDSGSSSDSGGGSGCD